MKKILILLILLTFHSAFGQNLVPNPSFEEYYLCPENTNDLFTTHWYEPFNCGTSSPEYYNRCAPYIPFGGVQVPEHITGYQEPIHGDGYVGLYAHQYEESREYVQVELNEILVEGLSYEVSFFISLADKMGSAIDCFGAHFSNFPIECPDDSHLINLVPSISANTLLTDYDEWMEIKGIYCALGGEKYLTLGNFFSDDSSGVEMINDEAIFITWSYYLVDSVSVIKVDDFIDVTVVDSSTFLVATGEADSIQWLDCNNDFSEIYGADSTHYTSYVTGNYCVEISRQGCVDTSDCFLIRYDWSTQIDSTNVSNQNDGLGFEEDKTNKLQVYPNPTTGILEISLTESFTWILYSVDGVQIQNGAGSNQTLIDLTKLKAGIYILEIKSGEESRKVRVVKE